MIIPSDWDELTDWIINEPFEARDAIVNLQRAVAERDAMLNRMIAEMHWMSGSADFGPGGVAERGWVGSVRPLIEECEALISATQ